MQSSVTFVIMVFVMCLSIQEFVALPVTQDKKDSHQNEVNDKLNPLEDEEYTQYWRKVFGVLENDNKFSQELNKSQNITRDTIANALELVHHKARTELHELKRKEYERLSKLIYEKNQLENGEEFHNQDKMKHIDHNNPHTFEINDLEKLIAKIHEDLDEADRKRHEEFR